MKIKTWVSAGIVYLVVVIGAYALITGENIFASGTMKHDEHEEESHQEQEGHGQHQISESEVRTAVHYDQGELMIHVEDDQGDPPKLEINHKKEMHAIVVSNDLEQYLHLHPKKIDEGHHQVEENLSDGQYQAFIDIKPKEKDYLIEANSINVGNENTSGASLEVDEEWMQSLNGKQVRLEPFEASVGEEIELIFDLNEEEVEPYLGAPGHVVILDEAVENFIHVHPVSNNETRFMTQFSEPGLYKLWAEFNYADAGVLAFPFVVEVKE